MPRPPGRVAGPAPSAHRRLGYPLPGCVPAEPDFVSPSVVIVAERCRPNQVARHDAPPEVPVDWFWKPNRTPEASNPGAPGLLKTVLNRLHKVKGFVYQQARFNGDRIEVEIRPRKGSRPICSGCGRRGPGYDTLEPRRFTFVPLWAIAVYLIYAKRRVDCPRCGVTVEQVPRAEGKHHLTRAYAVFLVRWARRLSWREVSWIFRTSWENV